MGEGWQSGERVGDGVGRRGEGGGGWRVNKEPNVIISQLQYYCTVHSYYKVLTMYDTN